MLNLRLSVSSVCSFVIGIVNDIVKGPIGVNQSTPTPVDVLSLLSSINSS